MKAPRFIPKTLMYSFVIFSLSISAVSLAQEKLIKRDVGKSFEGEWQDDKAKAIVKEIVQSWDLIKEYEVSDIEGSIKGSCFYPFSRKGTPKRFFQVGFVGCPGFIGAIVFSKNDSFWAVEYINEHFSGLGCWQPPPRAKVEKIGVDRYGLVYQYWRNVQGGGGYVHYVALIDLGDESYNLILREEIYQEGEGPEAIIPKVQAISGANRSFYDIKIDSKIYRFRDGKYKALRK